MFALLKSQKSDENQAAALFDAALEQSLLPVFYTDYVVPDTLDGRFDNLALHLFLIMNPLTGTKEGQALSQDLFDTAFRYMEKDLREAGIGDMGVPKHMKRMMKGFNGRVHAYKAALEGRDWDEALRHNLYGTVQDVDTKTLNKMVAYIQANILQAADLMEGRAVFTAPKGA